MLSISALERETGLTKDTLRKWETRFGFPQPTRNHHGERYYTARDLERLLVIKRLLAQGFRPAKVVPLELESLHALGVAQCPGLPPGPHDPVLVQVQAALLAHDQARLRGTLGRALLTDGVKTFVLAILPSLNRMVGDGWANGTLTIHQEHLYSEGVRNLLTEILGHLEPLPGRPKILLTTPPEERHNLGLLMLQAILALAGARCVSLGTETPARELAAAARSHQAQIVALSFSIAFPNRSIRPFLQQVQAALPEEVQLWAGGAGLERIRKKPDGIMTFASLELAAASVMSFPAAP